MIVMKRLAPFAKGKWINAVFINRSTIAIIFVRRFWSDQVSSSSEYLFARLCDEHHMFSLSTSSTILFKHLWSAWKEKKRKSACAFYFCWCCPSIWENPSVRIRPFDNGRLLNGYENALYSQRWYQWRIEKIFKTYLNCKTMSWLHHTRLVIYCSFFFKSVSTGREIILHKMMENPRWRMKHFSYTVTHKLRRNRIIDIP